MRFAIVVLAAGASTRMGRPKLLLPWGGTSILGHLIRLWRELGAEQIGVVLAAGDGAMQSELDRLGVPPGDRIPNPAAEHGMFSSIRCAAQWAGWNPNLTHWIVTLGDQPHVRVETLRALVSFASERSQHICQPARQGRRRHPVVLPALFFQRLAVAPHENLKQFLQEVSDEIALFKTEDPALDLDIDHPADYEQAIREFG